VELEEDKSKKIKGKNNFYRKNLSFIKAIINYFLGE
jgi:hypothetical protein